MLRKTLVHMSTPTLTLFDLQKEYEQGMQIHTCNPSTWEAEAGGS
jgi:hypothetical protein